MEPPHDRPSQPEQPASTTPQDDVAWVRESAARLGLHLPPAHEAGVVENYRRLAQQAERLMGFDLDEREEPAPVYRP